MKFFVGRARVCKFLPAKAGIVVCSAIGMTALAQNQEPQVLIPIRGVPFGPAIPMKSVQPVAATPTPAAPLLQTNQQGPVQKAATAQQQALMQPQQPDGLDQQKTGLTQQPVSLLPTETAARQAATVAASIVPPDVAVRDISTLAGEYSYGNGFDNNCTLEISPDGRFLYKRCDCDDVVDQAEGAIGLNATGNVVLDPAKPRDTWPRGTSPVLVPVTWGQRLYLVPENDMVGFLNQVNRGMEPVTRGSMGSYYLREGDWDRPVEGLPDVPESWVSHLLAQPVQGMVAGKDPSGRWIINLGQAHGAFDGMELTALRSDGRRFVTLRVTETGTETSAVEVVEAPSETAVQGWAVYSRMAQSAPGEEE